VAVDCCPRKIEFKWPMDRVNQASLIAVGWFVSTSGLYRNHSNKAWLVEVPGWV